MGTGPGWDGTHYYTVDNYSCRCERRITQDVCDGKLCTCVGVSDYSGVWNFLFSLNLVTKRMTNRGILDLSLDPQKSRF